MDRSGYVVGRSGIVVGRLGCIVGRAGYVVVGWVKSGYTGIEK